jgi:glucuronate isomerase
MRANGVDERYATGDAPPYEKFLAWARTAPQTLRNPLYHWTHLELQRYFGIDDLLDESTAPAIWEKANAMLATDELRAHGILRKFSVKALCTTDDPADDLDHHKTIALPAWRRKCFRASARIRRSPCTSPRHSTVGGAPGGGEQRERGELQLVPGRAEIAARFLPPDGRTAFRSRHRPPVLEFPQRGGSRRLIFDRARGGKAASPEQHERFASYMMLMFGLWDAERGWTKQLHIGARRNNNSRRLRELGPDTGFDSIGDWPQADALGRYMDRLADENALPKMVIYNLNPADNYVVATMVGNFQDGKTAGKVQFGSGWWFLDQKEAMTWQMNALSNCG